MYICLYMHMYIYVCVYIMHVFMHNTYVLHMCMHICACSCMFGYSIHMCVHMFVCIYVSINTFICIHFFPSSAYWQDLVTTPPQWAHLALGSWLLHTILLWKEYGSLKKWLIPGIGPRKYKVNLEHLIMPKGKCLKNDGKGETDTR